MNPWVKVLGEDIQACCRPIKHSMPDHAAEVDQLLATLKREAVAHPRAGQQTEAETRAINRILDLAGW